MPVGIINIKGIIGSFKDENGQPVNGVEVVDVASQLQDTIDCESLDVHIDSEGGRCSVGFKIYDLLRAQKKPIRTIVDGECCSIATVIYLAGDTREPLSDSSKLMIHNPWLINVSGNADELMLASEDIRQEEENLLSFYSKVTGVDKSILHSLMKEETYMPRELALKFNFSTQAAQLETIALKGKNTMSKPILDRMKAVAKKIGVNFDDKKVALQLKSGDVMLDFPSDAITIGDTAMIGGEPAPDGDYIIDETGVTITVVGGLVTNIVDPAQTADQLAAEVVALKAENALLKAENAKAKEFETEATETLAMIEKTMGKGYTPPARTQSFARTKDEVPLTAKERRAAYKK